MKGLAGVADVAAQVRELELLLAAGVGGEEGKEGGRWGGGLVLGLEGVCVLPAERVGEGTEGLEVLVRLEMEMGELRLDVRFFFPLGNSAY